MLTLTLFRIFWILFHKKKTFLFLQRLGFEKDCVCNIEGYKTFHTFRSKKPGGGVSIFTKKSIHSVQNLNLSYCNDNIEACIVEINPNVGSKENSMIVARIRYIKHRILFDLLPFILIIYLLNFQDIK